MALAYLKFAYQKAAEESTDPSTQNGAVLIEKKPDEDQNHEVDEHGSVHYTQIHIPIIKSIYSTNHFPKGVQESEERWTRPLKYKFVEHAERNVIYLAAKQGFKTEGATMVVAWAACADCARAVIQAGIAELITHHDPYANERFGQPVSDTWKESITVAIDMMKEAGVKIRWHGDKLFPNDEVKIKFNGILVSP
jgi:deoxycytidylate deaminase